MHNSQDVPDLSVLLVTFNHENHIVQALDGLLIQNFSGSMELVIADDASTDNTISIIQEYLERHPEIVHRWIPASGNVGITSNYKRGFAACRGRYVAVLEGDDYWVHPLKLERQADFLDDHRECGLCSVNYFVYQEETAEFSRRVPEDGSDYRLVSARELIADNLVGNFSTCMYRASSLRALPPRLFEMVSYDWIISICIARTGLVGFLNTPMSVYRLHQKGAWSNTLPLQKLQLQLDLVPQYDELTEYVFHEQFSHLSHRLQSAITASQISQIAENVAEPVVRHTMPGLIRFLPKGIIKAVGRMLPNRAKQFIIQSMNKRNV